MLFVAARSIQSTDRHWNGTARPWIASHRGTSAASAADAAMTGGIPMRSVRKILLVSGAILALTVSASYAGPCNTAQRDAGSGKVPGFTGQTTGSAASEQQHPPTATMNKATENTATSSQDAQRQMQGQPTAAQQAESGK